MEGLKIDGFNFEYKNVKAKFRYCRSQGLYLGKTDCGKLIEGDGFEDLKNDFIEIVDNYI